MFKPYPDRISGIAKALSHKKRSHPRSAGTRVETSPVAGIEPVEEAGSSLF